MMRNYRGRYGNLVARLGRGVPVRARWAVALGFVLGCGLIGLGPAWFVAAAPTAQIKTAHVERALTNPIITENALAGTDEWADIGNYDINHLSAYPGATSVNAGAAISIYVKSSGSSL